MTSEPNPYANPPETVAIFAHLADAAGGSNHFVPAGLLENLKPDQSPVFVYGKQYLRRSGRVEVDPRALRFVDSEGGVARQVLQGLSEFGGIRDAAPDAWGRRVIENKLKVRTGILPEVAYLLEAGSDRVGALDVRERMDSPPRHLVNAEVDLQRLLEVADKIENDEPVPDDLLRYFNGLGTAGGARPKATVRDSNGVLWLAKFPSQNDRACNAVLEGGALDLARAAGIRVPPTIVRDVGDRRVLLIRRFDRYWAQPGQLLPAGAESWIADPGEGREEGRIAFCSGMTLMGIDEFAARTSSYEALAQAIRAHGCAGYIERDVKEVFQRMVYNILANNNDDHLRNHGFIYDVAAKGWRLSPLYDVLPMNTVAFERHLHLEVGEQGRIATLDNALSRWQAFHTSRAEAVAAIHHLWKSCLAYLEAFEAVGATTLELELASGAFRRLEQLASPTLAKELREHD